MQRASPIAAALALAFLPACGSSASDTGVEKTLERGVAHIGEPQTAKQLRRDLVRTLARLHGERASSASGREARRLAIQGFASILSGVEARLEITRNDSGNLEATVRDAKRADRDFRKGARLLRAAGRVLRIQIDEIDGF
jgi:hypothetical protein